MESESNTIYGGDVYDVGIWQAAPMLDWDRCIFPHFVGNVARDNKKWFRALWDKANSMETYWWYKFLIRAQFQLLRVHRESFTTYWWIHFCKGRGSSLKVLYIMQDNGGGILIYIYMYIYSSQDLQTFVFVQMQTWCGGICHDVCVVHDMSWHRCCWNCPLLFIIQKKG